MTFLERIKIIIKSIKNFCILKKIQNILIQLILNLKKYNLGIKNKSKNFLCIIQRQLNNFKQKWNEYWKKLWTWIKNIFSKK